MNNYEYALNISRSYAVKGNCKKRNYGCIIIGPDGHFISAGYTHAEVPCEKCNRRYCKSGTRYDKCPSIHAEQDAVAGVAILKNSIAVLTCYDAVTGVEVKNPKPCPACERLLRKAGVVKVVTPTREFAIAPEVVVV